MHPATLPAACRPSRRANVTFYTPWCVTPLVPALLCRLHHPGPGAKAARRAGRGGALVSHCRPPISHLCMAVYLLDLAGLVARNAVALFLARSQRALGCGPDPGAWTPAPTAALGLDARLLGWAVGGLVLFGPASASGAWDLELGSGAWIWKLDLDLWALRRCVGCWFVGLAPHPTAMGFTSYFNNSY